MSGWWLLTAALMAVVFIVGIGFAWVMAVASRDEPNWEGDGDDVE